MSTNVHTEQVTSAILTFDISDHPPVFCILDAKIPRNHNDIYFRHDCRNFNEKSYRNDLTSIDWDSILESSYMKQHQEP